MATPDSSSTQLRTQKKSHKRHLRRGNILISVIGVVLFAWVVVHSGPSAVAHQLKALRIALPLVIALSVIRLVLQTRTWSAALKNEGLAVSLRRLIGIRLASQAMGYLTVFGPVLSEPMKINLLRTPVEKTATATFLDNGVYWFTSALVGIAGCVSISVLKSQSTISTLAFCGLFGLIMLFILRRESVLVGITNALGRRSPSWLNKAAKIESAIRKLRAEEPQLVGRMFWLDVACQLLLVLEVAVVLWSLRLPFHLLNLLAIEGLTRCVKMVTGFVPARLGADEGGAMSAFAASGLSPALGLTLAFTRRARDLSWAFVGLTWLAFRARASKQSQTSLTEGTLLCNS
jgi:hypothetical protein